MNYNYIIKASIPRNFDPEVEGVTLDSIIISCRGYITHSVPYCKGKTEINMELDRELDKPYLIGQLDDNFSEDGERVVLEILCG